MNDLTAVSDIICSMEAKRPGPDASPFSSRLGAKRRSRDLKEEMRGEMM